MELDEATFSGLIAKALPFLHINPVSDAVCIHAEAYKSGVNVNYINGNIDWESSEIITTMNNPRRNTNSRLNDGR